MRSTLERWLAWCMVYLGCAAVAVFAALAGSAMAGFAWHLGRIGFAFGFDLVPR